MAQAATESSQPAELQQVTVTARRVEENIQRVPIAVTVVPSALIENTPYFNVENFSQMAVGLTATAAINSRNQAFINIRGQMFGVVNYFDEVPITNPQPTAIGAQSLAYSGVTMDSASVQVLRGPQGTQFGRNATGGAVLFETQAPTDDFEAFASVGGGNHSLQNYEGMVNLPLVSDKLSLRVVGERTLRDGFTRNTFDGSAMDNLDAWDARVSLLYKPFDGLQNRLVLQKGHSEADGTGFQLDFVPQASVFRAIAPLFGIDLQAAIDQSVADGPRVTTISVPTGQRFSAEDEQTIAVNTTRYEINEQLAVKNILGYYQSENTSTQNYSGSVVPFYFGLVAPGIPGSKRHQYTDELQLQFTGFGGKVDGVVGAFYGRNTQNDARAGSCLAFFTPVPTCTFYTDDETPRDRQTSKAAFTLLRFDLSNWLEGLNFTAGYRRTKDEVHSGAATSFVGGPNFSLVPTACAPGTVGPDCRLYAPLSAAFSVNTYNFDFNYQLTPDLFTYVTTRRGYRLGGFNGATAQTTPFAKFEPEFVTDYEIGLKSNFHLGQMPVQTNVAAYLGKYTNIQQNTTVDLSVYNGLPPNTQLGNVTQNAAKSTVKGVELEVTAKPLDALTLGARANFIRARYSDFHIIIQQPGIPLDVYDASGQTFPNTPERTYAVNAVVEIPMSQRLGKLTVGGDWYWQSETEGAEGGTIFEPWAKISSWSLTNFNASWSNVMQTSLDVSLFLNNAFDQVHVIDVEAPAVIAYRTVVFNEPRMYGLRLRYTFGKDKE